MSSPKVEEPVLSSRPEILAPAGDYNAFLAAVENGADAVYLGGTAFSARAFAGNFSSEEMAKAITYAHLHHVKIYVTVNTLIDNGELKEALSYIENLYHLGVDGLIIQDLGLAFLVSRVFPHMPLHGSTQMTVHNREGVQFLKDLGFKRVVLARELSLGDIALINQEPLLELEIFGHGALCISYSGQCLMSSLIGARSGNRGKCAQPCRLTYTLVDEQGKQAGSKDLGSHFLSPRDLNTLALLPKICQLGISSLKFEGRMKRPEYVATVIATYRGALDRCQQDRGNYQGLVHEEKDLAQIFNRDFTSGYLLGNPGQDLMSYKRPNNRGIRLGRIIRIIQPGKIAEIKLDDQLRLGDGVEIWVTKGGRKGFFIEKIQRSGQPVTMAQIGEIVAINISGTPQVGDRLFKTHDTELMERAQNSYLKPSKKLAVSFNFSARLGAPFTLTGEDEDGHQGSFRSTYIVEMARKHVANEEDVRKQLNRLGDTSFRLKELTFNLEEGLMLPASELNTARRQVIKEITAKRLAKYNYPSVSAAIVAKRTQKVWPEKISKPSKKTKLAVRVGSFPSGQAALASGADRIYIDGEEFRSQKGLTWGEIRELTALCQGQGSETVFALPSIFHPEEADKIYRILEELSKTPIKSLLVNNIGGIQGAKNFGWPGKIYTDVGLNVFNDLSMHMLRIQGIDLITLSLELNFSQIAKMNMTGGQVECIAHGALPMMVSAYCAIGSILGANRREESCTRPCCGHSFSLQDRLNYHFPIEVDQFCRMHIYNSKELCLLAHVAEFIHLGVDALRIEGKRYAPSAIAQVTKSYRQALDAAHYQSLDVLDLVQMERNLAGLTPEGLTKGHYFRGVL